MIDRNDSPTTGLCEPAIQEDKAFRQIDHFPAHAENFFSPDSGERSEGYERNKLAFDPLQDGSNFIWRINGDFLYAVDRLPLHQFGFCFFSAGEVALLAGIGKNGTDCAEQVIVGSWAPIHFMFYDVADFFRGDVLNVTRAKSTGYALEEFTARRFIGF